MLAQERQGVEEALRLEIRRGEAYEELLETCHISADSKRRSVEETLAELQTTLQQQQAAMEAAEQRVNAAKIKATEADIRAEAARQAAKSATAEAKLKVPVYMIVAHDWLPTPLNPATA